MPECSEKVCEILNLSSSEFTSIMTVGENGELLNTVNGEIPRN